MLTLYQPNIVQHLSLPPYLRYIHLQLPHMRSPVSNTWQTIYPERVHKDLETYADENPYEVGSDLHNDVYARTLLLDLVETVLLPRCTQAPLHRDFDFFKDTSLRKVGVTFYKVSSLPVTLVYQLVAERVVPNWNWAYEEKKGKQKIIEDASVVVGGWFIRLEGGIQEWDEEPWKEGWNQSLLFGGQI